MNFLDKLIEAVSPERAVKRAAARHVLPAINSGYGNYGANTWKKSMMGWLSHGGSAKEDIEDNIVRLRERSRDAYMGIPIAAALLKTKRTNVIAGGLMPAPKIDAEFLGLTRDQADQLQRSIVREFSLWADTRDCDADGMENFYRLQNLAYMGYLMNGDALALLYVNPREGVPYDLQIRMIEADRICSPYMVDVLTPQTIMGYSVYRIVQGVETDEAGAVRAFWIRSRHPLSSLTDMQPELDTWTRVEARGRETGRRNALYIMTRERAGQVRGVPMLAPVLESLKQLGRYNEAELTAALVGAMFTMIVEQESPSDARPFGEMLPEDMLIDEPDKTSIELGPGAILSLNPGEKANFAKPEHPNTGYASYVEAQLKQIAAAGEVPYEVLMKNFQSNFSASRGALNEFWRTCDMERDWLAESFCQPIYEEWFAEAVAKGRIQAPGFFTDPAIRRAYTECTWCGPARTNLNPVQEVTAAINRVNAGFSTAQEETAQMTGGDYYRNIELRLIEAEKKKQVDDIAGPMQATGSGGGTGYGWRSRNDS